MRHSVYDRIIKANPGLAGNAIACALHNADTYQELSNDRARCIADALSALRQGESDLAVKIMESAT